MKIAIFSDIHDNLTNLKKALQVVKLKKISYIFILGDICSPFIIPYFGKFKGNFYIVFGNVEGDKIGIFEKAKNFKNIKIFYKQIFGEKKILGIKIGFVHWPEIAFKMAQSQEYKIVFFGHTHKKKIMKIKDTLLINPGEIAGNLYPPSFAILDIKSFKAEFIDLNNVSLKIL